MNAAPTAAALPPSGAVPVPLALIEAVAQRVARPSSLSFWLLVREIPVGVPFGLDRKHWSALMGCDKAHVHRAAADLVTCGVLGQADRMTYVRLPDLEVAPERRDFRAESARPVQGPDVEVAPERRDFRAESARPVQGPDANPQVSGTGADSVGSLMNHGSSSHGELHDHERLIAEFAGRLGDELRHRFYGEDHNGRTTLGRLLAQAVAGGWRSADLAEALARYIAAEQARRGVRVVTGAAIKHVRSGRLGPPPIFAESRPSTGPPAKPPKDPLTEAFEEGQRVALLDPTAATRSCLFGAEDPALLRARLEGARIDADAALAALEDIPDGEAMFGALLAAAISGERVPA